MRTHQRSRVESLKVFCGIKLSRKFKVKKEDYQKWIDAQLFQADLENEKDYFVFQGNGVLEFFFTQSGVDKINNTPRNKEFPLRERMKKVFNERIKRGDYY